MKVIEHSGMRVEPLLTLIMSDWTFRKEPNRWIGVSINNRVLTTYRIVFQFLPFKKVQKKKS